jgi:phosphatidylserine decarboxylase
VHKEGYGLLLGFVLAALVLTLSHRMLSGGLFLRVVETLLWLCAAFIVFFFRDPERHAPTAPGLVVSPADGTVVEIVEELEPEFIKAPARRISIFLSPFDVHVNRSPIDGEVKYYSYRPGKFLRAFLSQASLENEQSIIGMQAAWGRVTFKQIAGILARRIVCEAYEGRRLERGERFGIIKFGSRMDVYLPLDAPLKVRVRDKVKAGESILGEIKHGS